MVYAAVGTAALASSAPAPQQDQQSGDHEDEGGGDEDDDLDNIGDGKEADGEEHADEVAEMQGAKLVILLSCAVFILHTIGNQTEHVLTVDEAREMVDAAHGSADTDVRDGLLKVSKDLEKLGTDIDVVGKAKKWEQIKSDLVAKKIVTARNAAEGDDYQTATQLIATELTQNRTKKQGLLGAYLDRSADMQSVSFNEFATEYGTRVLKLLAEVLYIGI